VYQIITFNLFRKHPNRPVRRSVARSLCCALSSCGTVKLKPIQLGLSCFYSEPFKLTTPNKICDQAKLFPHEQTRSYCVHKATPINIIRVEVYPCVEMGLDPLV